MDSDEKIKKIIAEIQENQNQAIQYFLSLGLHIKRAKYMAHLLAKSSRISDIPLEKRVWALKNGFIPDRLLVYSLTDENKDHFLSDVDYQRMHPLNNHFAFWINDKLTLKYILNTPLRLSNGRTINVMPEYYLYIENDGRYSYLMDSPSQISQGENYIINLLNQKKDLALKPNNGAGGKGFFHFAFHNNIFEVNNTPATLEEIKKIISDLKGYIVTEYIKQHEALNKIWSNSTCTLRIIVCRDQENKFEKSVDDLHIIASYARFGTSKSGGTSNLSSAGVGVPFNFETGELNGLLYRYKTEYPNEEIILDRHPDTKINLNGFVLPNYELVKETVYSICQFLSSLDYFGFDIIITEEGLKICEINSLPSLDYEQIMQTPVWLNKEASNFFSKHLPQNN